MELPAGTDPQQVRRKFQHVYEQLEKEHPELI